jgi:hypothetical protein
MSVQFIVIRTDCWAGLSPLQSSSPREDENVCAAAPDAGIIRNASTRTAVTPTSDRRDR